MKKIIFSVLGVSILTASLGIGIYLVRQKQSTKTEATGPALSLSPSTASPRVGDTFTVAVAIDTKGMDVTAADLKVRYNTSKLEAQSIQATGNFLPTVLLPGKIDLTDTASSRASIVLGALIDQSGAHPKNGIGILAQVTFRAKAAGSSNINFGGSTAVAALGQNTNVVGTMNSVQITVVGATVSPTVTSTSSPTPKPADINKDGVVDIVDIGIIIDHYLSSASAYPDADINSDGIIDIIDIGIVIDNLD